MASLFKTPQRYLKYTIYIPTLQHTPIFLGVAFCQSLIGFRQTVRGSIVFVPCLAHGVPQLVLCFEGALAKISLGNANRRMLCPMLPRMPYRMRQKEWGQESQKLSGYPGLIIFKQIRNLGGGKINLSPWPPRSLSEVQESAQYMAGHHLPEILLNGVLRGSDVPKGSTVLVCNLTPYDCHLEKACIKWSSANHENPARMKCLSLTSNVSTAEFCTRSMAMELLKDMDLKLKLKVGNNSWL